MKSPITVRAVNPETDLPAVTRMINLYENQPVSEEEVRSWFAAYAAPEYRTLRLVSVDAGGAITGYSRMLRDLASPEGHFRVWLCVDPACQGQGAGSALWDASLEYLRAQGAARLASEVSDHDPQALTFAERRGFKIEGRLFHSVLDLTAFDETPFLPIIAGLEAQGIRFCSLADFPNDSAARRKLFDLNAASVLDIPGVQNLPWTYEEFEKFIYNASWFRADGQLLAVDGDIFAGLSAVRLIPETRGAYNEHTGVDRAYRGRKIATALKVLAACYARQNGAVQLGTDNDSRNAPILAINQKMGYQAQSGRYLLTCWL